jgi:hypothetical protein
MEGNLQNDKTIGEVLANVTDFRGNCPVPFLDQSKFEPHRGGRKQSTEAP